MSLRLVRRLGLLGASDNRTSPPLRTMPRTVTGSSFIFLTSSKFTDEGIEHGSRSSVPSK
jgi:hypothetical protein